MKRRIPIDLLICRTGCKSGKNGWAFPSDVKDLLLRECEGLSILHLFGGRADFGTRLDIDPYTEPDYVGDAYAPPFPRDSFDVVIMDPPYVGEFQNINACKLHQLFSAAAWIAKKRVIWFHPQWVRYQSRCRLEKSWLVCVGNHCIVRALQFFHAPAPERKLPPIKKFKRGSAVKYNRWIKQPEAFAFMDDDRRVKTVRAYLAANSAR